MECQGNAGSSNGFVNFRAKDAEAPSSSFTIPDHFRVKVAATTSATTSAKPKPKIVGPTSLELQQELGRLNAEREARMQALLAKRKSAKSSTTSAPPPPPPPMMLGSRLRKK
jgi:hypothetical protein